MVAGFLPHIDHTIAKYPKDGGNSASIRNVELMAQCSKCLFQGWNETVVVRTDVHGSFHIKCALLSKLEPPDPEADNWRTGSGG